MRWRRLFTRELRNDNMFVSLLLGRWLVLLPPGAALLLHALAPPPQSAHLRVQTLVFLAALASNVLLTIWHRVINAQLIRRPYLLGVDLLLVAGCLALTGGTQSPYFFYAVTPLLAASFFFQVRGGMLAALLFTPLYLAADLIALHYMGSAFDEVEALAEVLSFYGIALVFGYSAVLLERLREASQQLHRTQDELARAETLAALGKMVAHVSHEIRNPLTILGGYARYIERKADDPEAVRRHAQVISENVMHLEELLTDLLDLTHRRPPTLASGDLHELLDQAWLLCGGTTAPKPIILQRRYAGEVPRLQIDRSSLLRAFLNVMRNAVQFMPQGGTLLVSTRMCSDEVQIEISDSGPGIKAEALSKIFTPFVTHREHGTGLGLAVAQEIVHQHGGRIEARSEPGQGACFIFYLPVSAAQT